MHQKLHLLIVILFFILPGSITLAQNDELLDLVDPFIGTGGHGHTYPGAVYPFGMVQLSPDTRLTGWDGCSGYHYTDSLVYGFSHTHLSGTGVSDYGDILIMPYSGTPRLHEQNKIASRFSHNEEKASPGYYQCKLLDYGVDVQLTVTPRCGLHQYTFHKDEKDFVLVDLIHRDQVLDSYLKINNEYEIEGYRISSAWARDQRIYFVARFSLPFSGYQDMNGLQVTTDEAKGAFQGDSIRLAFNFHLDPGDPLLVKVGISAVSIEGARKNLLKELPNWNFEGVLDSSRMAWKHQLSKIEVFGGSLEQKRIFYTALYHTMIVPNLFSDVDGTFRGLDGNIHKDPNQERYTVFSLWDTYRATHPLYTLIERERTGAFIRSMIGHYEETGLLPVWELAGNETNCMIGTHGVSVIADALMKGIVDFPLQKAFDAMQASLNQDKHELNMYRRFGYMPSDEVMESVSKTLEYAYDDWCLSQAAYKYGKMDLYDSHIRRAQYYKNIFDTEIGFMRPKLNGGWRPDFDPKQVDFNYTEANAWQYSFYVPQDISGLIRGMGGDVAFDQKLDELFTTDSQTTGRQQADITGLIGQYAHGNEPSHHMAYLYNFIGKPWKTQKIVHRIMNEMYSDLPDGYAGNEDCGQMSAWYVFSALGFYPVTPGSTDYVLGSPLFPRAIINFEDGQYFIIEKESNPKSSGEYVQSVQLNKTPYLKSYITHEDIVLGGKLSFYMNSQPSETYGVGLENSPQSSIAEPLILPVARLKHAPQNFRGELELEIVKPVEDCTAYYRLRKNGKRFKRWKKYTHPIKVNYTGEIEFYVKDGEGRISQTDQSQFFKLEKEWNVELINEYSPQYTGSGENGLIDHIRGMHNFADGNWQGYQGVDFIAIVDMGEMNSVSRVKAGFLQAQKSWIWYPLKLSVFVSTDNSTFEKVAEYYPNTDEKDESTQIQDFELNFEKTQCRYVKLVATNRGTCPEWHPGSGQMAWVFVDEIDIE